jgi:hypothetical protein
VAGREGKNEPTVVDQRTQWNILFGSFADNLGSVGTIPMCLSPLMFTMFYSDFVVQGASPIMSQQAHKWIYTLVAVVAVPGALIAPFLLLQVRSSSELCRSQCRCWGSYSCFALCRPCRPIDDDVFDFRGCALRRLSFNSYQSVLC